MAHEKLREEFLKHSLEHLSDEERDLRSQLPTDDYIDLMEYVEWLENEVEKERLQKAEYEKGIDVTTKLKRTK